MKMPSGLGKRGRAYWKLMLQEYTFTVAEIELLAQLCRCLDTIEALEQVVAADGPTAEDGRVRPAVAEIRQQTLVLARLTRALRLPVEEPERLTASQRHAQVAAQSRWRQQRVREGRA